MSFSSAYAAVSNADTARENANTNKSNSIANNRRLDLQQQANMLKTGLQVDSGSVEYTDAKQQEIDQLKMQLAATNNAVKAQQSYSNANGITNTLHSIVDGNWQDAYKYWNDTPGLKQAIAKGKSLDAVDIQPINFNDPSNTKVLNNMGIHNFESKDVQDALNSSFMQVQGHNGKWRVMPVDQIVKATNTYNMFTKQQADSYNENARRINSIIKGANPNLDEQHNENVAKSEDIKVKQQELNYNDEYKWLQDNPDKTINDYKNLGNTTGSRRDTLSQLQASEAQANGYSSWDKMPQELKNKVSPTINTRMMGGQGQIRESKDIGDSVKASEMGKTLLSKPEDINDKNSSERETIQSNFINTKNYATYKKEHQEFIKGYVNYKIANSLQKDLNQAIKDGKYKSGIISSTLHSIAKFTPDEFKNYIVDPDKYAARLGIDTQTSSYLAGKLKDVSGTAVADTEYIRRLNDTLGSSYYDENTRSLIFKNSVKYDKNKLLSTGKTLVKVGLVGDVADMYKSLLDSPVIKDKPVIKERPIYAVNPSTGEKLQLIDGKWESVK